MENNHKEYDVCLTHLDKILASPVFEHAKRSSKLLKYIVEKSLRGEKNNLKEYTIAVEAFGLSKTFDQHTNPKIRVEAKRLRDRLKKYYIGPGKNDLIEIQIPKGSYFALFLSSETENRHKAEENENPHLPVKTRHEHTEKEHFIEIKNTIIWFKSCNFVRNPGLCWVGSFMIENFELCLLKSDDLVRMFRSAEYKKNYTIQQSVYPYQKNVMLQVKLLDNSKILSMEKYIIHGDKEIIEQVQKISLQMMELLKEAIDFEIKEFSWACSCCRSFKN